ncbi:major capsid protein [Caulobacter vibrioides]|uniref:Major capsid protein n=1 Tax=Caulobacter vibrioides TaxID=155892 RepID=A0A290N0F3_CAUVI|nr:major capsid protein [Caulobacter vibrioides]ATC34161.1 major capsid protein [Caulobacter vibrioides]
MSLVNVFRSSLFTMMDLTAAINESETPPQRFAELGIFEERGVRTTSIFIEKKGSTLQIVPTSPRGAPGTPMSTNKREGREFRIPHISVTDEILADEVQDVRAFGSESDLVGVQQVRGEKNQNMAMSLDNTLEYHRLGAIQGVVLDADGSVIYDYFDEFGIAEPDTVYFDLGAAWAEADGGRIRGLIGDVKNNMRRALKNSAVRGVHIMCGEDFFRDASNHPEMRETYLAQQEAADLRGSDALDIFRYGGAVFEQYPGYGDVEIAPDEARFIPLGVPKLFQTVFAPAPWFSAVNRIGLPRYAMASLDKTGEKQIDLEAQSNPLNICTRPEVLFKASSAADPG